MSFDIDRPETLTLADLTAAEPPAVLRGTGYTGLAGKFKQLIKTTPGIWYKYPKLVTSRSISKDRNFQWTQRNVTAENGKRMLQLYARYIGDE